MAVQEVTAQAWPPLPVFAITTSDGGAHGSALSSSGAGAQNAVLADSGPAWFRSPWGFGGGVVAVVPPTPPSPSCHGGQ